MASSPLGLRIACLVALAMLSASASRASFVTFESGQVRPLALSPDGNHLFAVNTPDGQLEIFTVAGDGTLTHSGAVPVGLEPVAVAARSDDEVWVVNHLSDSVSVVDVAATPPRVIRTLLVGDEPRDIVFAGPTGGGSFRRAFITTARRGQHLPTSIDPALTTPGTPRALVWVFDAEQLGTDLGGTPETIIELFGDTPRALAASPDGVVVYAAVFHSGNQTTSLSEGVVCNGGAAARACALGDGIHVPGGLLGGMVPGGLPAPNDSADGQPGPETGLIVKFDRDAGIWKDGLGRNWTNAVRFDLPDHDVFKIDALADPPAEVEAFAHVGTVLFNMTVDPVSGALFVSNTDAHNEVRFEGAGASATTVRGNLHQARITVIDAAGSVLPRHLNKHIDALPFGYRTTPMPADIKAASVATPLGMAMAGDGSLYLAAFGSSAVVRFDRAALQADSFTPSADDHIPVSGGGPTGLVLDEIRGRLYVLTRFDNAVKVIDTAAGAEIAQLPLHNPEPAEVVGGRRFLYDAQLSSSNGEASCSSCHVFADFDSLAWDLGNPDDDVVPNRNPMGPISGFGDFHPLKGPMTTQTLRGMAHGGPMHWRGDRTGSVNGGDALDETLAFAAFNGAFGSLLGRDEGEISEADMAAFTRFALAISLPPNPVRALDNKLTAVQQNGRETYLSNPSDGGLTCNACHTLDPSQGFFGSSGLTTFEAEPQLFKVAHLRNAYQKVGMFGMPDVAFLFVPLEHRLHQGEQVRGFGFLHDGSIATVFDFLHATVFSLGTPQQAALEQYIFAFDTTFAPVVGQQVTARADNAAAADPRIGLLMTRAQTGFTLVDQPGAHECDLIAKGVVDGEARGYLYDASAGTFSPDRSADSPLLPAGLRALVNDAQSLTYTCVPPGSGVRIGIDRDEDGFFDGDELNAGTDPTDPTDVPAACAGDCDFNAVVTVDELVRGVAIALGREPVTRCLRVDTDGDRVVTIGELIGAVRRGLDGCAA